MKINWNLIITIVLGIGAIYATFYAPIWDQKLKSISIKAETITSLHPAVKTEVSDITVTVDGQKLDNPYLVVFEIHNNGSKPIASADFESNINIIGRNKTKIIKINNVSSYPASIRASTSLEDDQISIKPTLLNPGDKIIISIIANGTIPLFEAIGRIIGVSDISLAYKDEEKPKKLKIGFYLIVAFVFATATSIVSDAFTRPGGIVLRRRSALTIAFASLIAISTTISSIQSEMGYAGWVNLAIIYIALNIPAIGFAIFLNKKKAVELPEATK